MHNKSILSGVDVSLSSKSVLGHDLLETYVSSHVSASNISRRCIFLIVNWQNHGLRTTGKEIAFTTWPKILSHSQIFRYGRSIFCLPYRPKFSDFFDLCLHWVSVVRGQNIKPGQKRTNSDLILNWQSFKWNSSIIKTIRVEIIVCKVAKFWILVLQ